MSRGREANAAVPAVLSVAVALGGLMAAYFTANSDHVNWPRALQTGFFVLLGSAVLSAVFAFTSLALRLTWYGILLSLFTALYAGGAVMFLALFSLG